MVIQYHNPSNDKVNTLRFITTIQKAFLNPGMHINEESNMFKLQPQLIQSDQLNMLSYFNLYSQLHSVDLNVLNT